MASSHSDLVAHPLAPPSSLLVAATATLDRRGLVLRWVLRGDLAAAAIAPRSPRPGRRDRLWEHTCCEAFIGGIDGEPYLELNLSPSGDWALWAFDRYRTGMRAAATGAAPEVRVIHAQAMLQVDAIVDAAVLRGFLGPAPYVVGLASVVEAASGERSFLAQRHVPERPDFHARDTWLTTVYPPADA